MKEAGSSVFSGTVKRGAVPLSEGVRGRQKRSKKLFQYKILHRYSIDTV
jgi:hypothetical protein